MKKFVILALAGLLHSNPASALVRVVETCQTPTGSMKVVILDNQGIGMVRKSNLIATVSDSQGPVVTYPVNPPPAIQSVSFGRSPYTDRLTHGRQFSLSFPSTNFKHTSLFVLLPNGMIFTNDNMICR